LFPGVSSSLTFVLIRRTLFLDGLAPRYQRPPLGKWRVRPHAAMRCALA